VILENLSTADQCVWDEEGREYRIAGRAIAGPYPREVARKFLSECEGRVLEHVPELIPSEPGTPDVWLANNTGSPNFPESFVYYTLNRLTKQKEPRAEPHPNREPRTLNFEYDQGQRRIANGCVNLPNLPVRLAPFSRRRVPETVARAWLTAQAMGDPSHADALILSREPTAHEPNDTWDLDEIVAYAVCLSQDFRDRFQAKTVRELGKDSSTGDILKEKQRILKPLHFFLINPEINLPTKHAVTRRLNELKREKDAK